MADTKGILALGDIPRTQAPILEVKEGDSVTISSINITNASGSTAKINLYLSQNDILKHILPQDKTLNNKAVMIDDTPYMLARGDKLRGESDVDGVEFVITGTIHTT